MTIYKNKNFNIDSAKVNLFSDGDILEDCMLACKMPHTELFCKGKKLKFIRCNLQNVELWKEAELINCFHIHQEVSIDDDIIEVVE